MVLEGVVGACSDGGVVLIKDCLSISGSFVLHGLLKRIFTGQSESVVAFIALASPFSHYARIARKQGCNLISLREKGRLFFLDAYSHEESSPQDGEDPLLILYRRIKEFITAAECKSAYIMIDDVSLLEVIAHNNKIRILDFLHYCRAISCVSGKRCSTVLVIHEDVYEEEEEEVRFVKEIEHTSSIVVSVKALMSGMCAAVHGQIEVVYRDWGKHANEKKQFKVMHNTVTFFLPGLATLI